MGIRQINFTYDRIEDRVLVRINTQAAEEFRVWLTRPMCRLLLESLLDTEKKLLGVDSPALASAAPVIQEFRREKQVADADFSAGFQSDAKAFPLGEKPLLVINVRLVPQEESTSLLLDLVTRQTLTVELARKTLHSVIKLLISAQKHGNWGLQPEQATDAAPPSSSLH